MTNQETLRQGYDELSSSGDSQFHKSTIRTSRISYFRPNFTNSIRPPKIQISSSSITSLPLTSVTSEPLIPVTDLLSDSVHDAYLERQSSYSYSYTQHPYDHFSAKSSPTLSANNLDLSSAVNNLDFENLGFDSFDSNTFDINLTSSPTEIHHPTIEMNGKSNSNSSVTTNIRPLPRVPSRNLNMNKTKSNTSNTSNISNVSNLSKTPLRKPLPLPPVLKKQTTSPASLRMRANSDASRSSSTTAFTFNSNQKLPVPQSLSEFFSTKEQPDEMEEDFQHVSGAFISEVAERFLANIPKQAHTRDSLEYQNSFTGRQVVDTILEILGSYDRKLGLDYGRCLESHKLFHDVTFETTLKDDPNEIFTIKDIHSLTAKSLELLTKEFELNGIVTGVYTNLTNCYSPTCTKDGKCYISTCPYKTTHKYSSFKAGSPAKVAPTPLLPEPLRVWAITVPKYILDSTPVKEKKRQEAIYEFVYTEKDFVDDLELLQEYFIKPLLYGDIIPIERRQTFIEEVFFNIMEIYAINFQLSRDLMKLQERSFVVDNVGDTFLNHVHSFEPFVAYGAHQLFAKQSLDVELSRNPTLVKFLDDHESLVELRKLPIHSFMSRPTTRLAKYSLLLEAIIKHTEPNHKDRADLYQVIDTIKGYLNRINVETGKADNKLKLARLNRIMTGNSIDLHMLNLLHDKRQLIRDGIVKKKTGVDQVEISIFLFDHLLLLTKKKLAKESDSYVYKVHKKPIPLGMVQVTIPEDIHTMVASPRRASNAFVSRRANSLLSMGTVNGNNQYGMDPTTYKSGFPFHITHLGRDGHTIILYASTLAERKQWKDKIEKQRATLTALTTVFQISTISDNYFKTNNRVNCSATYDSGRFIVVGTEAGVYLGKAQGPPTFSKILELEKVALIEILEDYNMFIVLSEKNLYTYALDALHSLHPSELKGRRISSNVTFFKVGVCLGRCLVCVVKSNSLNSVVKALEPVLLTSGKKASFGRFLMRAGKDGLRLFKKFYIPSVYTSLHFLKTKVCVGCAKGFELVDLETLNTQGLLDETDPNLNFVTKREFVKPIAIYRVVNRDFLLCYDEFAFYVDKDGRRARLEFVIMWQGEPASFAFEYPYILGFSSDFVEVWHVETGRFVQVIPTGNSRSLSTKLNAIHCVMNPNLGFQHIFALHQKPSNNLNAVTKTTSHTKTAKLVPN